MRKERVDLLCEGSGPSIRIGTFQIIPDPTAKTRPRKRNVKIWNMAASTIMEVLSNPVLYYVQYPIFKMSIPVPVFLADGSLNESRLLTNRAAV